MSIQITGSLVETPPVYDKIFIVNVRMEQKRERNRNQSAECKYTVDYQLYGESGDNKYYLDAIKTVRFTDAGEGLTDLLGAIANALTDDRDVDTATVL